MVQQTSVRTSDSRRIERQLVGTSLWAVVSTAWRCCSSQSLRVRSVFFFFQAEDGIRDVAVTGVQTCALPIFRGAPEGHQSPGRRRARGAREPAPRRHRAARPHGAPALDALRRDAVALECVGNGQGRPRGAGGRAAVLRGQGPEGSLRPDGESSDRARDRRSAAHMAPAMRARALLVLAGVAAAAAPGAAQTGATRQKSETAVFAGGCFWGVDAVFRHVRGVMAVVSGYAGGGAATAHYDIVSTSTTGHAESVEVTFDPARVSYEELLRVFFTVAHHPTERDRQGPDVGSQYRSVVFYGTPEQHTAAVAMIAELERARAYPRPIVTEVVPLERFFPAEAYHQDYLAHHLTSSYIVYNDLPKLKRLEERFPKLYQRP